MKYIDLRSDTVTQPTKEMREAMMNAEVGDDVLSEDPTVNKLEKLAAEMFGKEAAIFVPSGTFGNQLAIFSHCERGSEVIISDDTHVVQYEAAAASVIAGVQLRTVKTDKYWFSWDEIDPIVRKIEDIHMPKTGLICMQNSLGDGSVMPLDEMKKIYKNAQMYNIPVHIDGARIFNAAAYLNVNVKELAKCCDSVMFCLSKGLCAPVGSVLVGSEEFITKARAKRKLMGGGMRQAGVIAAPGIIALEEMTKKIPEDHQKAQKLAKALSRYDIIEINPESVHTNIFYLKFNTDNKEINHLFPKLLKEQNILIYPPDYGFLRFVTHHDVSDDDIDYIIDKLDAIVDKLNIYI